MVNNKIWSNLTYNWSSQNATTEMSTTAMTIAPENEDRNGLLIAIVVSSCIGIVLIISGGIVIVRCHKKKLTCSLQNTEKQKNEDEGKMPARKNIGATNEQRGTITDYDNLARNEYGMSNLNSAWDAEPEPYTLNNTHVDLPTNSKNNEIVVDIKTETHKIQTENGYQDADSTFSPMQGFVSSLLSRYEEENIPESRAPNSNSTYEDEDEFQCSEQMKERGACIVKSDFDPKTLKYKSTPGLLKTKKGETLVILQNDLGSGWTCVRNSNTSQTGFVPSNHLEILS